MDDEDRDLTPEEIAAEMAADAADASAAERDELIARYPDPLLRAWVGGATVLCGDGPTAPSRAEA